MPPHRIRESLTRLGAAPWPRRIVLSIKAFWSDTDGVILPYVTVMLVVIIGVSVLALDGARFMYLQTQLQNGADALAFAAAAELDRMPTAIERASNAISKFGRRGLRLSKSRSHQLRCQQFCRHQFSAVRML